MRTKMTLAKLLPKLEEIINEKMNEFAALGKESKRLRQELDEQYTNMRTILQELDPVMPIVRDQNPNLCGLFDELMKEPNGRE